MCCPSVLTTEIAFKNMDHVAFLVQERLEAAQVQLSSTSSNVRFKLSGLRETAAESLGTAASSLNIFWHSLQGRVFSYRFTKRLSELLSDVWESLDRLQLRVLYDRCLIFLLHEVTRTHAYLCCACFLCGAVVGMTVGQHLRQPPVHVPLMRAVVVNAYTGIEGITVVEDLPAPRLHSRSQVLVQVKAAGVDSLDLWVAQGYGRGWRRHLARYNPNLMGEFPVVLGRDCAGVVVAAGADVEDFVPGDEVWLAVPMHQPGTLSEYVCVDACLLSHKPPELTMEAAAALAFPIMQAWGVLQEAGVRGEADARGKRFLVLAGSSGVGCTLVQVCSAWGGHVTAVPTSTQHAQLALLLGAVDAVAGGENAELTEKELDMREKFDVVLNPLGSASHEQCLRHTLPDGVVVTGARPHLPSDTHGLLLGALTGLYRRLTYLVYKSRWAHCHWCCWSPPVSGSVLTAASNLVASGRLQAVVERAYTCQDAEEAFHRLATEYTVGRSVVRFSAASAIRTLEMSFWPAL